MALLNTFSSNTKVTALIRLAIMHTNAQHNKASKAFAKLAQFATSSQSTFKKSGWYRLCKEPKI